MKEGLIWSYMAPRLKKYGHAVRIENSVAGSLPDFMFSTPSKVTFIECKVLTKDHYFKMTKFQFVGLRQLFIHSPENTIFFAAIKTTALPIYLYTARNVFETAEFEQKEGYVKVHLKQSWDLVICDDEDLAMFVGAL